MSRLGDQGKSLLGKRKIRKDSLLLETIGSLDELISFLGVGRVQANKRSFKNSLLAVQKDLSKISAVLAGYEKNFPAGRIKFLEKQIKKWQKELPPLKNFVFSGGSEESAWIHVCRTVCRRAERRLVALSKKQKLAGSLLGYLNRLSLFLFFMARSSCQKKSLPV